MPYMSIGAKCGILSGTLIILFNGILVCSRISTRFIVTISGSRNLPASGRGRGRDRGIPTWAILKRTI